MEGLVDDLAIRSHLGCGMLNRMASLGWRNWLAKRRRYGRNPGIRRGWQIHRHMARTGAYIKYPIDGNVLEGLDSGRLTIGEGTLLQPGCWLTLAPEGRIAIGAGCALNHGVMLASVELIEIGDHVMFANNCFVGDADHRYDDRTKPITRQGTVPRGPVRIGSNCWFGVNCAVTGGVEIGDRCVIGANSVVTSNIPPEVIAAGAPARVIRTIEFKESD
jgi:acetyltransferase-like isoleucine patch superfamily enzyme